MDWKRVHVLPVVANMVAFLAVLPVDGDSRENRPATPQLPNPVSGNSPTPAHVSATTLEWNVSEAGERRSMRIIGGEAIPDDDVHVGLWELAPRAIYAGHAHPVPEYYVALEGRVEWTLGNDTFIAEPGEFIYIAPNTMHRMVNLTDDIAQAVWGRWAPDGDRSVYEGVSRYVEPIPEQPPEAVLFPKPGQSEGGAP